MGFVINGANFGTSQGTSAVSFAGANVTPLNWSSTGTSITVQVPTGAVQGNANVIVTVGGQASNAYPYNVTGIINCVLP
jgi:hypothetical protein